jgi:glycosyltransferase involved in cell wall biosynthesis
MKVIQVFRKPHERFFSIESVFGRIRSAWPSEPVPEVVKLPSGGVSLTNLAFTRKLARDNPGTVIHITGDAHYTVLACPRNRTILTIHDAVFLEQQTGWKRWLLKKILLDLPVRYSRYITTISEKSKAEILRYTGCPASRVRVIPNPVSPLIFYRSQPFNAALPKLLFIGVKPNKNLERVCQALQGIPCTLAIIGKLFAHQVSLLEQYNIRYAAVHGITEQQMAAQFADADIVLFPSLYEGFGLPVIEGFRAGRVVVTSNISPMKDVASGGACLVDPYSPESIREGVLRVIRDLHYRESLVERGFEVVRAYEPSVIAAQYFSLYREVHGLSSVH